MKECLITRLKSVVNDDSLEKLGHIKVVTTKVGNNSLAIEYASKGGVLSLSEDSSFEGGGNSKPVGETGLNRFAFTTAKDDAYIDFSNYYGISVLEVEHGTVQEQQKMKYMNLLKTISVENLNLDYLHDGVVSVISKMNTYGTFENIKKWSLLESISLANPIKEVNIDTIFGNAHPSMINMSGSSNVKGNVESIRWKVNELYLNNSAVSGYITRFLVSQRPLNIGGRLAFTNNNTFLWDSPLNGEIDRYMAEFSEYGVDLYLYPWSGAKTLYATYSVSSSLWTLA